MPIDDTVCAEAFRKLTRVATDSRTNRGMGLACPLDHFQTQPKMDVSPDSFDPEQTSRRKGH